MNLVAENLRLGESKGDTVHADGANAILAQGNGGGVLLAAEALFESKLRETEGKQGNRNNITESYELVSWLER